jgi:hypothetical protein
MLAVAATDGTRGWPAGAMATPNTVKKFKYLINISILKQKNYHFTYFYDNIMTF